MPTDAPIGRWGFVLNTPLAEQPLALEPLQPGRQFYCRDCRGWYMATQEWRACPACGYRRFDFNKEIRTKQLNRDLYEKAAQASAPASVQADRLLRR
jgi:hypothetical protein